MQKTCRFCYNVLTLGKVHYCIDDKILEEKENLKGDVNNFAGILFKARKDRKLTLNQVSEQIGISMQYISQLENGIQIAPYRTIEKLATFYNLDKKKLAELKLKSTNEYREYENYLKGLA